MSSNVPQPEAGRSWFESGSHSLHAHGVSWAAVIAGAIGATALSLVLVLMGVGFGFSAISPWRNAGASAASVSVSAVIWLTFVQVVAAMAGGYLAGRLRSRWASLDVHEVYFRDTAHGFLTWALTTLFVVALLSSAAGSAIGGGARAGAAMGEAIGKAGGAAAAITPAPDILGYFTDELFRPGPGGQTAPPTLGSPLPSAEVGRILVASLKSGSLSQADSQYLAQLVAQRAGLSADEAQKRVDDTYAQLQQAVERATAEVRQAADEARKAAAGLAYWAVVTLLIGAFTASWSATFGGRLRDGLGMAASNA